MPRFHRIALNFALISAAFIVINILFSIFHTMLKVVYYFRLQSGAELFLKCKRQPNAQTFNFL